MVSLQVQLNREMFVEYGLSILVFGIRFFARWKIVGFRNFDLGDLFAGAAIIFFTYQTAGNYLLGQFGTNIGYDEESVWKIPDSEVPKLQVGSKLALGTWSAYICLIFCLKAVMLCLYRKVSTGLYHQEMMVKALSVFTGISWLACILTHLLICTPIHRNWQIKPYPGNNCTLRPPNYYVIGILNCITDFFIMLVPMPLLFKVQLPLQRKMILGVLFGSGFFIIIATILRTYYSLHSLTTLQIATGWACRETFVAILVVCAPAIKPLFNGTNFLGSSNQSTKPQHPSTMWSESANFKTNISRNDDQRGMHYEMGTRERGWRKMGSHGRTSPASGSEERIIMDDDKLAKDGFGPVHVTHEYTVSHEEASVETRGGSRGEVGRVL